MYMPTHQHGLENGITTWPMIIYVPARNLLAGKTKSYID